MSSPIGGSTLRQRGTAQRGGGGGSAEVGIGPELGGAGDAEAVETLIIGGGLSGIHAAALLSRSRAPFLLLEARDRTGGRILCREHQGSVADLGPSWYWPTIHPRMARLVAELGLTGFPQFVQGLGRVEGPTGVVQTVHGFATEPPSWRLVGGMAALIAGLVEQLPAGTLRLDSPVCRLERQASGVRVGVGDLEAEPRTWYHARQVILALPPRLAAATILFDPDLSPGLTQAMLGIGTWMAGQAKFCALYEEPFWREAGLSGEAFSHRGPLSEIHDSSDRSDEVFGLNGFVGVPAVQRRDVPPLTAAIRSQLAAIYGAPATEPTVSFYQDWARERFTATRHDQPPMYEHPPYHPPAGRASIWDDTVLFAGTETADEYGGYLEGALAAAERAVASCRTTGVR